MIAQREEGRKVWKVVYTYVGLNLTNQYHTYLRIRAVCSNGTIRILLGWISYTLITYGTRIDLILEGNNPFGTTHAYKDKELTHDILRMKRRLSKFAA